MPDAFEAGSIAAANCIFAWLGTKNPELQAQAIADWNAGAMFAEPKIDTGKSGEASPSPAPSRADIQAQGYTGDNCSNCGSMRMRVAGHCLCCDDCGTTTGCS